MNERERTLLKCGRLEGIIETMKLYAIWKDGEQFIGVMQRPLKEELLPFQKELTKLQEQIL